MHREEAHLLRSACEPGHDPVELVEQVGLLGMSRTVNPILVKQIADGLARTSNLMKAIYLVDLPFL